MNSSHSVINQERADFVPPKRRSNTLALFTTVSACVIALILAIFPRLVANGSPVRYDASLAIYTITFMGIAAYTYYQRCTLNAQLDALASANWQYDDQRRQSQRSVEDVRRAHVASMATAVLAELPQIVTRLRVLSNTDPWSYHDPLSHPLITESLKHVELFDAETVHQLASVEGRLGEIEELVSNYRHEREVWHQASAQLRDKERLSTNQNDVQTAREFEVRHRENLDQIVTLVMTYSRDAHNAIPALNGTMRRLGGVAKPRPPHRFESNLPALLPDPFAVEGQKSP